MGARSDPGGPVRIEPVTAERLADLDRLLDRGDPRTCQCAFMRLGNAEYRLLDPSARRHLHHEAITLAAAEGRAAGLLAYRDDEPVGWVSFDVRERYGRLSSSELLAPIDDTPVWSVVCFVVAARARRHGVAGRLLEATTAYAAAHDATMLEGYPAERAPGPAVAANLWRGTQGMFERAGFDVVEIRRHNRTTPARPIMRRPIPSP